MKEKIKNISPLIFMLMIVLVLTTYTSPVNALQASATHSVVLNIPESVAITVSDALDINALSTGASYNSNFFNLTNEGNTRINVYITAGSAFKLVNGTNTIAVSSGGSANYQIWNGTSLINIPSSGMNLIYTNMTTKQYNGAILNSYHRLYVPLGAEMGTYTNTATYTAIAI